jgi:hypothetical protein
MESGGKSVFALFFSFVFMTLLVIVVTVVLFPDVGVEISSPIAFLLGAGCVILLVVTLAFLPFSAHVSLRYIADYCSDPEIGSNDSTPVPGTPSNSGDEDASNNDLDNPRQRDVNQASHYHVYARGATPPCNTLHSILNNVLNNARTRNASYHNNTTTAEPYLILIFSYVIVFCLNVLLLDTYFYSQQRNSTEVSLSVFMEKTTSLFTEHLMTMVCLFCYLASGFYAFGEISSYILNCLCYFNMQRIPGGLVICIAITWFLNIVAVIVCYRLLPDENGWTWKDGWLAEFPLIVGVIYLTIRTCKGRLTMFPLPRYPRWLLYCMYAVLFVTAIVTVLTPMPTRASSAAFCASHNSDCVP